jgi:uncharacterized membrane protein YedE/YeeE
MGTQWPAWIGGGALSAIVLGHWLLSGRMLGISGRYSAIVNRLRSRPQRDDAASAELLAAMEAATRAAFGDEALAELMDAGAQQAPAEPARSAVSRQPSSVVVSLIFLGCLVIGGFLSAILDGRFVPRFMLDSELLPELVGRGRGGQAFVLCAGGLLVGFGTRLAGGCTSGHGLCGVSRFQRGSLVATAAFFGAGVTISLMLGGLAR